VPTCDPNIWGLAAAVIQIVAAILLDAVAVERTASDAPDQIRLAHDLAMPNLHMSPCMPGMHLANGLTALLRRSQHRFRFCAQNIFGLLKHPCCAITGLSGPSQRSRLCKTIVLWGCDAHAWALDLCTGWS
jgi:hypothetical protein